MNGHFATLNANQRETNRQLALANLNYVALNLCYDGLDQRLGEVDRKLYNLYRDINYWRMEISDDDDAPEG